MCACLRVSFCGRVFVALQALGRQLVDPGEDQRDGEPYPDHQEGTVENGPIESVVLHYEADELQAYPAGAEIQHGGAQDVPFLQLPEYVLHDTPLEASASFKRAQLMRNLQS